MLDSSYSDGAVQRHGWVGPVAVVLLAAAAFGFRLSEEPEFPDEWAYVSQAYFAALLAEPDNPLWLEYPAYDLPPLPKYAIGLALGVQGYKPPSAHSARQWYTRDITLRFGDRVMLTAARWPSVLFGVVGCLSLYALGSLALDRRVGFLAAALLALDPLYRMHARRAMSDVPAEALVLACLAVALWGWRALLSGRGRGGAGLLAYLVAGVLGGLAVLSKLTGGLSLMVLAAWVALAIALPGVSWARKARITGATAMAGALAFATFLALNPFLWSNPAPPLPTSIQTIADRGLLGRTAQVIEHRASMSDQARAQFPHNALSSFGEKVPAVAVQGFGRFGPLGRKGWIDDPYTPGRQVPGFDSTIRFDRVQDLGVLLWLPLVLVGGGRLLVVGRRQQKLGEPPTCWAIAAQAALSVGTVAAYIPMAWDRYYLPIQAPACLLGATALVLLLDSVLGRFRATTGEPGGLRR